jgi:phosphatidate cytidylyltransferase
MSELVKRTISGIVFVGCVVGAIVWNLYAFSALFFLFGILSVDEFHRLVKSPLSLRIYSFIATVALWAMILCFASSTRGGVDRTVTGLIMAAAYFPIMIITLLDEIWNHSDRPLQNWGNFFVSQFMIALPLATLMFLYFLNKWLLLALFVLIWVNDTGAYCVGSLTAKRKGGNHKMTPHISPKKSWEGLVGGFAFTLGASFLLYKAGWFDAIMLKHVGVFGALLFGFLVSAFGTMGDLMESLMKRSIGVKDSGKFLPGHGGILDRFDSVLLAAPILTLYCWLCSYIAPVL